MNRIFKYLLQGILYIAPMAVTVYIIYLVFDFLDNILSGALAYLHLDFPGIGLLVIILFLIMVGYLGQTILANPLKAFFRATIMKIPILNVVYTAFSDLFSAFVGKEKKFNKPVMVLMNPGTNVYKLGFLTEDDLTVLGEYDKVAVYFPHSYNFSGEMFIVPKEQVRPVKLNAGDVMKFIVSGGVSEL
jgi:uncharacterized membrane protein